MVNVNSCHCTVCQNAFILPELLRFCMDQCSKSVLSYSSSPHVSFQSVHIKTSTVPLVPPRLLCCHLCLHCSILHTVTQRWWLHRVQTDGDGLTTENAVRWQKTLVCFTLLLSDHGGLKESSVTVCWFVMWSVRVSVCADEKVWSWNRSRSVGLRISWVFSVCERIFLFCVSVSVCIL